MTAACHYWDASALVKVVARDAAEAPGRAAVQDYFHNNGHHYATPLCVAEALSAVKLKWAKRIITQPEYTRDVREFFRLVVSHLTVDEVPLAVPMLEEAERHMTTHKLDFIDAIQLVTVLRGKYAVFVGDSKTLFITADHRLAVAARKEGVKVWECTKAPPEALRNPKPSVKRGRPTARR